jgi:hypothetical protein
MVHMTDLSLLDLGDGHLSGQAVTPKMSVGNLSHRRYAIVGVAHGVSQRERQFFS